MTTLQRCPPRLAPFHVAGLLETAVVNLNRPAGSRPLLALLLVHRQVVRRPVLLLPIGIDGHEDANEAIPSQVDFQAIGRNVQRRLERRNHNGRP